jgi:hypothetical protein
VVEEPRHHQRLTARGNGVRRPRAQLLDARESRAAEATTRAMTSLLDDVGHVVLDGVDEDGGRGVRRHLQAVRRAAARGDVVLRRRAPPPHDLAVALRRRAEADIVAGAEHLDRGRPAGLCPGCDEGDLGEVPAVPDRGSGCRGTQVGAAVSRVGEDSTPPAGVGDGCGVRSRGVGVVGDDRSEPLSVLRCARLATGVERCQPELGELDGGQEGLVRRTGPVVDDTPGVRVRVVLLEQEVAEPVGARVQRLPGCQLVRDPPTTSGGWSCRQAGRPAAVRSPRARSRPRRRSPDPGARRRIRPRAGPPTPRVPPPSWHRAQAGAAQ